MNAAAHVSSSSSSSPPPAKPDPAARSPPTPAARSPASAPSTPRPHFERVDPPDRWLGSQPSSPPQPRPTIRIIEVDELDPAVRRERQMHALRQAVGRAFSTRRRAQQRRTHPYERVDDNADPLAGVGGRAPAPSDEDELAARLDAVGAPGDESD